MSKKKIEDLEKELKEILAEFIVEWENTPYPEQIGYLRDKDWKPYGSSSR